jgi:hypothetical protein
MHISMRLTLLREFNTYIYVQYVQILTKIRAYAYTKYVQIHQSVFVCIWWYMHVYDSICTHLHIRTQYVHIRTIRTYTYILYLARFQPIMMPLIYVQIHAYTCIYQHIHTYTYIYMQIRSTLNEKVWIVVRCQCPAVTRTRCRQDTASGPPGDSQWLVTGHRRPAAPGGSARLSHWPWQAVTHTLNQPESDGRPAAGPPAGCHGHGPAAAATDYWVEELSIPSRSNTMSVSSQ